MTQILFLKETVMYENFGQSWKIGLASNYSIGGIDSSVWKENDYLDNIIPANDLKVWLYVLEDMNNKSIFKIGITTVPYKRCQQVNNSCSGKHNFIVKEQKFIGCRKKAYTLEQAILSVLKPYRVYKRSVFDGATEVIRLEKSKVLRCYQSLIKL